MRNFLKGTAILLLLSGTALASAGIASADTSYGRPNGYHRDRAHSTVVRYADVSMGYRDGYRDKSHTWHKWNNDNDSRTYRGQHADKYHDWNHDRDDNNRQPH
jgi:hypothetical protein